MKKKVSCIICAYNEKSRISKVLKVAVNHPWIDEIIVVDDGSIDKTGKEASKFKKIKLIRNKKNFGKSKSMYLGCQKAKNEFVLFLDADLIGLKKKDITSLLEPIIDGDVDMTISMRKNNFLLFKILGHEFISGERALRKDISKKVLKNSNGYAAEVKINEYILRNRLKFRIINWPNVKAIKKIEKKEIKKAIEKEINMIKEITKSAPASEIIKQMVMFGFLSYKDKKDEKEVFKKIKNIFN